MPLALERRVGETLFFFVNGKKIGHMKVVSQDRREDKVILGFDFDKSIEIFRDEICPNGQYPSKRK